MGLSAEVPGSARLVLASGVVHLDEQAAVFEAMLSGWDGQQRSRLLSEATIAPRVVLLRRFTEFAGSFPWQWNAGDVEDFTVSLMSGGSRLAPSTIRGYHLTLRMFFDYLLDVRYGWVSECEQRFGVIPSQVCHHFNTVAHLNDYEGRPGRRPFTYDELQHLFDFLDTRVERVQRSGRKGAWAALRDARMVKTCYAYGLRRRELCNLDVADLRPNPHMRQWGTYGAVHVRYGKAARGELTKAAAYGARSQVNGAIRLCQWATAHGTPLTSLTQGQLEAYLAEYPGARNSQQGFVAWLRRTRTNTAVTIPWREKTLPEVIVAADDRWAQVELLLHDDTIPLYARIGGLFTLLLAQPLETIVAMSTDQITVEDDGRVFVTFDALPIEMPPGLDDLIRRHLTRPGTPSIASTGHGWLFPGRNPGRHLVREVFRGKLVTSGIRPGNSRHAAMFALASEVPAPILAELIGIADKTATQWATLAARDWSEYVTQRDPRRENG